MTQKRWTLLLVLTCIALAVIMQVPQLLHMRHPLYQGRLIELNDDEAAYMARVEEALNGRPEFVEEAFIGDGTVGMHFAFIEQLYGYLFSWTGLHAAVFLQIEDSVIPVILFLALYAFFRLCGFSRAKSYGGCLLFLLVSLYYLDRPINQRTTSLFMVMALLSVILALERHVLFAVLAGILLAILLDVYFWSWTYAYAFCALLLLFEIIFRYQSTNEEEKAYHARRIRILLMTAAIMLVTAIPMYLKIWKMLQHPMIEAGNLRAEFVYSRLPISWPYSILFFGMTAGALFLMRRNTTLRNKPYAVLMILTGFLVMHQQVVLGVEFRTVAGYQFSHIYAAITALLLSIDFLPRQIPSPAIMRTGKGWLQIMSLVLFLCATVFLLGKLVDNHRVVRQWIVLDGRFTDQHMMTSLPTLRSLLRSRIAAPVGPANFIASYTHHDIVYAYYLKNVLISNEELAERWCMANLGFPPFYKNISPVQSLLYNDTRGLKTRAEDHAEQEQMVREACERIEKDPAFFVEKYDVDYVFWDEKLQPTMKVEQYGKGLTKVASGEGWSLWKIPRETTN